MCFPRLKVFVCHGASGALHLGHLTISERFSQKVTKGERCPRCPAGDNLCVCSAAKRSRIRRERLEPRTFASFKASLLAC